MSDAKAVIARVPPDDEYAKGIAAMVTNVAQAQ
jgi:hypothetical protein